MDSGKAFLGRGFSFPLSIDPKTGKFSMSEGERDIREAIMLILKTGRGERVMRPGWGTDTRDYVFDVSDNSLYARIAHDVTRDITLGEPRIHSVSVSCRASGVSGRLDIEIGYTVRATNNRYNLVFPFYITEGGEKS